MAIEALGLPGEGLGSVVMRMHRATKGLKLLTTSIRNRPFVFVLPSVKNNWCPSDSQGSLVPVTLKATPPSGVPALLRTRPVTIADVEQTLHTVTSEQLVARAARIVALMIPAHHFIRSETDRVTVAPFLVTPTVQQPEGFAECSLSSRFQED